MNASELIRRQRRGEPHVGTKLTRTQEAAKRIAHLLLDERPLGEAPVCEASVHRPTRCGIWVATFTGPTGGQVWKSTGLTDRNQALLLAKRWEMEARRQRTGASHIASKPSLRVGRKEPGTSGPLTQKEVALLLNISERAVRLIERKAIKKLFNHPSLKAIWRQYLARELDEDQWKLTPGEMEALFNLARTPLEWRLLVKVTRLVSE